MKQSKPECNIQIRIVLPHPPGRGLGGGVLALKLSLAPIHADVLTTRNFSMAFANVLIYW